MLFRSQWFSIEEALAEHGYALDPAARDRFFGHGLDGLEHDEHSASREHYEAWQRRRTLAMLTESDVHPDEHEVIAEKLRAGQSSRVLEAYDEEADKDGIRTVLRFHPRLAPVKVAVLPLVKKDPGLVALAQEIYADLRGEMLVLYDESGAVGRRYRRQDEIGTPYCITVDGQSLEDRTVTLRERDSMAQVRVPVDGLEAEIRRRLRAPWTRPEPAAGVSTA